VSDPRAFRRPLPTRAAGVTVLLALLAAGCGDGSVTIRNPDLPAADRAACTTLIDALPDRVDDLPRRTTKGSAFGAAWGDDPAIVLRCGVEKPKDFGKLSACQRANGVDWFVPDRIIEDQRADVVMTTIGRSPAVEVQVPARLRPTLAPMTDLAEAIKAHTELVAPCQ